MLLWAALAFAADPPDPGDVAELVARSPSVGWLFAVDTSLPMLPVAQAARADIASLVDALPAGDRVEVLAWHTRPSPALPALVITDANRAEIVQRIRTLEFPSARDPDLGAGLAAVTAQLRADGAPRTEFAVVLGNFCHNPPISSEYNTAGYGCREVLGLTRLAAAGEEVRKQHALSVQYFPVAAGGRPPNPGGLDQAVRVLGGAANTKESFSAWVARMKADLQVQRLAPGLADEVEDLTVVVNVPEGATLDDPSARLQLRATRTLVDVTISDLRIEGTTGTVPAEIVVGDATALPVTVAVPAPPFSLFPTVDEVEVPIRLSGELRYGPRSVLHALGIPDAKNGWSTVVQIPVRRAYGLPGWAGAVLVITLAGLLGAAFVAWRFRGSVRTLGGSLHWRRGLSARVPLDITNLTEAAITIDGDRLLLGDAARAVLVLRVLGPSWKPRTEVEVRIDGVEINRKPVGRGRHAVVAGAASFHFGDFRLTWE